MQGRSGRKSFLEERSVDSAGVHLGWEIVWKPQRTEPGTKCLAARGGRLRLVRGPNWTKLGRVGLVGREFRGFSPFRHVIPANSQSPNPLRASLLYQLGHPSVAASLAASPLAACPPACLAVIPVAPHGETSFQIGFRTFFSEFAWFVSSPYLFLPLLSSLRALRAPLPPTQTRPRPSLTCPY